MKELVSKIGSLVGPIIKEKGGLHFFGLVLREDASVWDLLVAAEWIDQDRNEALKYLVKKVQSVLTKQELLAISAVILLQSEYYIHQPIMESEGGWVENNIDLYGLTVKKAYIFASSDGYFNGKDEAVANRIQTDVYKPSEPFAI